MIQDTICFSCATRYDANSIPVCPYCGLDNTPATSLKPLDIQFGGGHYKQYKIQPTEYNQLNKIPWCEANVIKYVTRHRDKNGLEDLKKAKHYIDMLIALEYGEV